MSRERILGAIEALEEIRAHRSWPQLGVTVVLRKLETLRAQLAALPPEPEQRDSAREILADIIRDLPNRRDWLDPVTERRAKELLASPEPEPWTPREREARKVIEMLLASAHPNSKEHPTMTAAWKVGQEFLNSSTPPPDPRDEALELMEVALVEYLER